MALRSFPARLLVATTASSLVVLAASGGVAAYLVADQARSADALSEDIGSRGAAVNLDATLDALVALHLRGAGGADALHAQALADLAEIDRYADKAAEQELACRTNASFEGYLSRWRGGARATDLGDFLRADTKRAVGELRAYNGRELAASEEEHRRSVRRTAWGLVAVGGLGSVGGLVFGFGLARSLRRTIQQYMVRVQGATDRLGRELPAVEVLPGGGEADGTDDLLRRVEQAVSRLNAQEREVRRAERLAAVGQLAAGVAHEIRNPLTSAVLLLETARKDPAAGGLTDDDLALIEQELHRIERSLQAFLTYARPPALERGACDLAQIARDALALARGRLEQAGIAAAVDADPGGCPLSADREQVRQVLANLVLNAADAMPDGGALTVAVRRDGGWTEAAVSDTGPGIAAAVLPRLFEPFATGKPTGTGLGLVVSRRIAEDHGGTLAGANPPGGGARFVLRLPASGASQEVRSVTSSPSSS